MIRTRKFRIAGSAVCRGKAVLSLLYRTVKELLTNRRGVFVPFTDTHGIAEVVNRLAGNEYLFKSSHCRRRVYGFGRAMRRTRIDRACRNILRSRRAFMYLESDLSCPCILNKASYIKSKPGIEEEGLRDLLEDFEQFAYCPSRKSGLKSVAGVSLFWRV
jgi:hypothetical protein